MNTNIEVKRDWYWDGKRRRYKYYAFLGPILISEGKTLEVIHRNLMLLVDKLYEVVNKKQYKVKEVS